MAHSLKSIIQQAVLAASASTLVLGCAGTPDTHFTVVVPSSFPDGGQLAQSPNHDQCKGLCVGIGFGGCATINGCSRIGPTADGRVAIDCDEAPRDPGAGLCTGRRPAGLARASARGPELGRYLAASAHLEAASVVAFKRLTLELRAHGAPPALVTRARQSAREEVRHARTMGRLARRAGGRVPRVEVDESPSRGLEALAAENATEGCVRETYGAALAAYQAAHAADHQLREALATIAVDESGHAQLAWDIALWAEAGLDGGGRERVHQDQRAAINALKVELASDPAVGAGLGLPDARQAHLILQTFERELWAPALIE
jgi:hypothetical protein